MIIMQREDEMAFKLQLGAPEILPLSVDIDSLWVCNRRHVCIGFPIGMIYGT